PVDPDRPGDVLELLLAGVLEGDVEPALRILVNTSRDADPAGLRQSFQSRGDIDAVAVDVVAVDDDVADIDADPELDPRLRRLVGIALVHAALNLDGATHGIDDAGEFGQQAVAGGLDDAALVFVDLGIEHRAPVGLQPGERSFLVEAHQPA